MRANPTVIDIAPDGTVRPDPRRSLLGNLPPNAIALLAIAAGTGVAVVAVLVWAAITLLPVLLVLALAGLIVTRRRSRRRRVVVR